MLLVEAKLTTTRPTVLLGLRGARRVRCYAALGMIHPAMAMKWLAAARITSE
jgi:hypothetical protein